MATALHRTTELTKKMLVGLAIGVVGLILFISAFQFVKSLFPKKIPPPTVSFGKLPGISFPANAIPQNFAYNLNTVTGQLPSLPTQVNIYKIDQPQLGLLSLNQAKDTATKNNFLTDPIKLSDSQYQWQNTVTLQNTLTYNIVTHDFTLASNYLTDATVLAAVNLPDPQTAITDANGFFSGFAPFPSDIDNTKTQTTLFSIQNGTFIPATSISSAQVIQVDFFQKDIDQIPIFYAHPPHSSMNAFVASTDNPNQVVQAQFSHKDILTDTSATYPLKTAQQAFSQLQANTAYIANYEGQGKTINIQNVFLAYYLGDDPQDYLMPIIVFQGDNNFFAYVSAVTDQWTDTQHAQQ